MSLRAVRATALCLSASLTLAGCSLFSGDDEGPEASNVTCAYESDGREPAKQVDLPPTRSSVSGSVQVTLQTSAGDITMALDADKAPCTVNSFVSLAQQGYFDDTTCHRLTTQGIYVLQCGDPTATGAGGPGYSFADELTKDETYPAGTLAMANAGPDTNGSQFFIVYKDVQLPPAYTVFGTVSDDGLDVVTEVAAKGTKGGGPDGPPKKEVQITGVVIK